MPALFFSIDAAENLDTLAEKDMSTYTDIEFSIDDPVALIRLNRPARLNAFTGRTLREIRSAVDAAADRRVVGIVVTGAGRRVRCRAALAAGRRRRERGTG